MRTMKKMNLFDRVLQASKKAPKKIAINFEGLEISYLQFIKNIELVSTLFYLKQLKKGDRVIWLGQNDPKAIETFFACAKLGLIFIPINWRLSFEEVNEILEHSKPSFIIYQTIEFAENIQDSEVLTCHCEELYYHHLESERSKPEETVSINDAVLISYTSGSTGEPKGVLISQDAILCNSEMSVEAHSLQSSDKVLNVLPICHVGGLNILVTSGLLIGASVYLHRSYDLNKVMVDLTVVNCAIFVPKILQEILEDSRFAFSDLTQLRVISIGSTIVPLELIKRTLSLGLNLVQLYGSTEVTPFAIHQRPHTSKSSVGSIGTPGAYCEIKLISESGEEVMEGELGEICVKGRSTFLKYFDDKKQVFDNGWFKTGDLARKDIHGNYWFVDRIKNIIISGGENIFPQQIESLFIRSFQYEVVAVIAKNDPEWGEVPVIFVEGESSNEIDFLGHESWNTIAGFKRPRGLKFLKKFPRNNMGKIDYNKLRLLADKMNISDISL